MSLSSTTRIIGDACPRGPCVPGGPLVSPGLDPECFRERALKAAASDRLGHMDVDAGFAGFAALVGGAGQHHQGRRRKALVAANRPGELDPVDLRACAYPGLRSQTAPRPQRQRAAGSGRGAIGNGGDGESPSGWPSCTSQAPVGLMVVDDEQPGSGSARVSTARTGAVSPCSSGSVNQNVDPWPRNAGHADWPSISSTSCLTIARPRPVPPNRRVVESSAWMNGSNICSSRSASMPMPVSRTSKRTLVSGRRSCRAPAARHGSLRRVVNLTALEAGW